MHRKLAASLKCCLILTPMTGAVLAQDAPPDQANQNGQKLGAIVVTGSAIPRVDAETPSPVTVISAAEIKRSGLTTVSDVVRSISADNSGTIPTAFTSGFAEGSSGVSLRGLTVNSTLVLVDGRRVASYALADDGERSFVDLNSLSLDVVDRIEVLKDGASSLYGADAIAGVVNIILKHDFHGIEASGEVGTSQHGGGFTRRATGTFGGGNLDTDHYNAYFNVEYQKDDRIAVGQRKFPFNTSDLSSIGGSNLGNGQPGQNSGSIYGSVTPGTLGTAGDLTTGIPNNGALAQPLRPCGPGSTTTTDSTGTYCAQNLSLYGDDQPATEHAGLFGRFTVKLDDYSEAYLTASYVQHKVDADGAPSQIQQSRPNNTNSLALPWQLSSGQLNPNNPFAAQQQYALINYTFGDIPGGSTTENHSFRVVGGVKGMFGDWSYDSAIVVNHTWLDSRMFGVIDYTQLISDINSGAYSFVDPASNSAAVRAALSPTIAKTSTTDLDSIDFRANRELFQMSGGTAGLALGAELRHEAQDDPDLNPNNDFQGLGVAHTIGTRNVFGLFGEMNLPILKTLEADVSGRFDHYSDFGSNFAPKVGLKWTPIEEVALRGTWSRGFRAPSFAENGSSAAEGFVNYTPPQSFQNAHNGDGYVQTYSLAEFTSANPNIKPEKSTSFTFGGVFQPLKSLSASLDYYSIKKTGVIVQSDPNAALAAYFAGQPLPPNSSIIADLPDPNAPNALARPIVVSAPYVNANSLKTTGVDLNLSGNFELGANAHFVSDFNVTRIISWKLMLPDGTTQQFVGTEGPYNLSSGAGTPRWRGSWANSVMAGPATVTATVYYTSGFGQFGPDIAPADFCLYQGSDGGPFPKNCHVGTFTHVDLTGNWRFTDNVDMSVSVLNLLDRSPPLNPANYAGVNYNPTYAQAGIVGRFYTVGVHVRF